MGRILLIDDSVCSGNYAVEYNVFSWHTAGGREKRLAGNTTKHD